MFYLGGGGGGRGGGGGGAGKGGVVVRALTSYQYGPGSNPFINTVNLVSRSLLTKPKARSGQVRKFNFFDWLD